MFSTSHFLSRNLFSGSGDRKHIAFSVLLPLGSPSGSLAPRGRRLALEIAVANDLVEQVVDAICKAAGTGKIGDGKIFVADLEQVIRIRTGETGNDAL